MGEKSSEKQFILEVIEVYHGLLALWDVKWKDYSNRAKKGEQYDVLLEKYREKYPDADKQQVVKKINSLRTNFRKELKRIRDAERSGAGAEDVEPLLWYFEEMKFLANHETPTASISTMDISKDSSIDVVDNNEDLGNANETDDPTDTPSTKKMKKKRGPQDPSEELVKMACQRLRQPQDDSDKIAAAWAVELRKMDPRQQMFAKKAINDILFEGQMGTLNRNSVLITQ
ncbi:hypothetical protein WN55_07545 [Dufourea novaeangliae]|uniref:MADF domain-containing protein n=1 Tax=Dufourea novaeangliae TaxID=178035 RepID=A0A154P4L7_DUFNO|nr:hypothetical protein WN55_07545 [Dufourea novaeangliae]